MKKKLRPFTIVLLSFTLLFTTLSSTTTYAANSISSPPLLEQNTSVESFRIQTLSDTKNAEGIYELTGEKNVNSITAITKSDDRIATNVQKIEDFYDINGDFIKSTVSIEIFDNNLITGKAKSSTNYKDFNYLKTIKSVDDSSTSLINKKEVSDNVKNAISTLGDSVTKDVQGFSNEDILRIQTKTDELKKTANLKIDPLAPSGQKIGMTTLASCGSYDCAGAFDNYYNYFYTSGNFTVQALSFAPQSYFHLTGSTIGSTKNSTSLMTFRGYIDNYETNIISNMNYSSYSATFNWLLGITTFAILVATWPTGPAGWVVIAGAYVGALGVLATLTSAVYATSSKLAYSQVAMQYQQNASGFLANYGSNFQSVTYTAVSGY